MTPLGFEVVMDNREMEGLFVKAYREGFPTKKKVNGKRKENEQGAYCPQPAKRAIRK